MNIRDWTLRLRALLRPNRVERDLHDELAFHVERETQKLIDGGMSPGEARNRAQARFGSTALAADNVRDQRGTAFIDNTIGDIQYALRTFKRAPLASFTIVATVAVGLGVVAILFTILNTFIFRVDAVPNIGEMYGVERPRLANGDRSLLTRPQFEALRRETAVFTDAYASLNDIDVRVDGRMMAVGLVSGNFFQVVSVNPVMGRSFTPADDLPSGGNPVIVLSDEGWRSRFGSDPQVLGRSVLVNGAPFEVIGVMPARFRGLEVSAPDFWSPISHLGQFRPGHRGGEDKVGLDVTGRLRPGVSPESARAQLSAWDSNSTAATADRQARTIELLPRRGTIPQPLEAIAVFTPLFFSFGLILLIGCANVANLLLARGVARQREIGVRLSLGATRRRIVRQLMTESLLLSLAAAVGGYLVSRIGLESIVYWVMSTAPADIGDLDLDVPGGDWRVGVFLLFGAVSATAFFGLMPALQATRVEPVRTLRGEVIKDARPGRARNALIGIQVFASALLLITSAIFLRSAMASSTFDPGYRTADTVIIDIINEPKRAAMLEAVAAEPFIAGYAALSPGMLGSREAFAQGSSGRIAVSYKFTSPEYFEVVGIPVVRGRSFNPAERDGAQGVILITESTARAVFPDREAVGEIMQLEADPDSDTRRVDEVPLPARSFTVIGVTRDIKGFRFADSTEASVFVPISADTPETSLIARVTGDPEFARRTLIDHLTKVDPNMGQVLTMRTVAQMEAYFLQIAFWVSLVLGLMALALTVSGLFSVLSYLVEQRAKEIGVRMALGATRDSVTRLVLAQLIRPVAVGLAIGVALSLGLATLLIATPAAATIAEIVHVLDPVAYAASLLVVIVACVAAAAIPASRASRLDPMQTLRQE